MMKDRYPNCPICHSKMIEYYTSTYDRHYGNINTYYDVFKCKSCHQLFLNPMISESDLSSMYDINSYYAYGRYNKGEISKSRRLIKSILFGGQTKFPKTIKKGERLLDIGCGSGKYLFEQKKKGLNVKGVEINKPAVEIGQNMGLNIFHGNLIEANFNDACFDFIRTNHSFEHLVNPKDIIYEIGRIIKKGGKLFIGVPNTRSLPFYVFGKHWYYLGVPFHPFNYNKHSLKILLKASGFKIQKVNYVGNYLGLVGSIQIWINRKNKKKSNEGYFTNFITRLFFQQIARLLNLFMLGDCIEIIAVKE